MVSRRTSFDEFKRACEIHRQWLLTARVTRSKQHYELAAAALKIAEEWRARAMTELEINRVEMTRAQIRVLMDGDA